MKALNYLRSFYKKHTRTRAQRELFAGFAFWGIVLVILALFAPFLWVFYFIGAVVLFVFLAIAYVITEWIDKGERY